jgi:hypothetical protein
LRKSEEWVFLPGNHNDASAFSRRADKSAEKVKNLKRKPLHLYLFEIANLCKWELGIVLVGEFGYQAWKKAWKYDLKSLDSWPFLLQIDHIIQN